MPRFLLRACYASGCGCQDGQADVQTYVAGHTSDCAPWHTYHVYGALSVTVYESHACMDVCVSVFLCVWKRLLCTDLLERVKAFCLNLPFFTEFHTFKINCSWIHPFLAHTTRVLYHWWTDALGLEWRMTQNKGRSKWGPCRTTFHYGVQHDSLCYSSHLSYGNMHLILNIYFSFTYVTRQTQHNSLT